MLHQSRILVFLPEAKHGPDNISTIIAVNTMADIEHCRDSKLVLRMQGTDAEGQIKQRAEYRYSNGRFYRRTGIAVPKEAKDNIFQQLVIPLGAFVDVSNLAADKAMSAPHRLHPAGIVETLTRASPASDELVSHLETTARYDFYGKGLFRKEILEAQVKFEQACKDTVIIDGEFWPECPMPIIGVNIGDDPGAMTVFAGPLTEYPDEPRDQELGDDWKTFPMKDIEEAFSFAQASVQSESSKIGIHPSQMSITLFGRDVFDVVKRNLAELESRRKAAASRLAAEEAEQRHQRIAEMYRQAEAADRRMAWALEGKAGIAATSATAATSALAQRVSTEKSTPVRKGQTRKERAAARAAMLAEMRAAQDRDIAALLERASSGNPVVKQGPVSKHLPFEAVKARGGIFPLKNKSAENGKKGFRSPNKIFRGPNKFFSSREEARAYIARVFKNDISVTPERIEFLIRNSMSSSQILKLMTLKRLITSKSTKSVEKMYFTPGTRSLVGVFATYGPAGLLDSRGDMERFVLPSEYLSIANNMAEDDQCEYQAIARALVEIADGGYPPDVAYSNGVTLEELEDMTIDFEARVTVYESVTDHAISKRVYER